MPHCEKFSSRSADMITGIIYQGRVSVRKFVISHKIFTDFIILEAFVNLVSLDSVAII